MPRTDISGSYGRSTLPFWVFSTLISRLVAVLWNITTMNEGFPFLTHSLILVVVVVSVYYFIVIIIILSILIGIRWNLGVVLICLSIIEILRMMRTLKVFLVVLFLHVELCVQRWFSFNCVICFLGSFLFLVLCIFSLY